MFLLMPWLLHRGTAFWPALGWCALLTIAAFAGAAFVLKRFGIDLMP
jgi:hypothetical protein